VSSVVGRGEWWPLSHFKPLKRMTIDKESEMPWFDDIRRTIRDRIGSGRFVRNRRTPSNRETVNVPVQGRSLRELNLQDAVAELARTTTMSFSEAAESMRSFASAMSNLNSLPLASQSLESVFNAGESGGLVTIEGIESALTSGLPLKFCDEELHSLGVIGPEYYDADPMVGECRISADGLIFLFVAGDEEPPLFLGGVENLYESHLDSFFIENFMGTDHRGYYTDPRLIVKYYQRVRTTAHGDLGYSVRAVSTDNEGNSTCELLLTLNQRAYAVQEYGSTADGYVIGFETYDIEVPSWTRRTVERPVEEQSIRVIRIGRKKKNKDEKDS